MCDFSLCYSCGLLMEKGVKCYCYYIWFKSLFKTAEWDLYTFEIPFLKLVLFGFFQMVMSSDLGLNAFRLWLK